MMVDNYESFEERWHDMKNKVVKIVFKDNTSTTFEDKGTFTVYDIKYAKVNKLPYILNYNKADNTFIIPTKNIKSIRIIDNPNKVDKEHEDEK